MAETNCELDHEHPKEQVHVARVFWSKMGGPYCQRETGTPSHQTKIVIQFP